MQNLTPVAATVALLCPLLDACPATARRWLERGWLDDGLLGLCRTLARNKRVGEESKRRARVILSFHSTIQTN